MQIICLLFQINKHTSTLSCNNFLQAGCYSWHPTNSVKALKAIQCWFLGLSTPASSLKDANITEQIVVIYLQPLARCKPEPTVNCKNRWYLCVYHPAHLSYTTQPRSVPILQTVIFAEILSVAGERLGWRGLLMKVPLICRYCRRRQASTGWVERWSSRQRQSYVGNGRRCAVQFVSRRACSGHDRPHARYLLIPRQWRFALYSHYP